MEIECTCSCGALFGMSGLGEDVAEDTCKWFEFHAKHGTAGHSWLQNRKDSKPTDSAVPVCTCRHSGVIRSSLCPVHHGS